MKIYATTNQYDLSRYSGRDVYVYACVQGVKVSWYKWTKIIDIHGDVASVIFWDYPESKQVFNIPLESISIDTEFPVEVMTYNEILDEKLDNARRRLAGEN